MNITKEQFDDVYNQHLPNSFIKFIYKYFSKKTEKRDMWLSNTFDYVLITLFLGGFILTIMKGSHKVIGLFTIPYAIILTTLVGGVSLAVLMNNLRIRKIRKVLGISKLDYNSLVSMYYPE